MTHLPDTPTQHLREMYQLQNFVETGCFEGGAFLHAKSCGFLESMLFSCDLKKQYVDAVSTQFPRARVDHAESLEFLRNLLPTLEGPTLFWLDAHFPDWYDMETNEDLKWPLIKEMQLIRELKRGYEKDVIICDDTRVIDNPENPRWQPGEMERDGPQCIVKLDDWQDFVGVLGETHTPESIWTDTGIIVFHPKV